jgi:glycosyltransferase involved in cell wall biosynthesis
MRIVVDMQGAQTESRFRGIGRYTLSFAKAIARNRDKHEVILALNGLLPDTIEPIRAAFDSLLPQENIRVWQAPGPVMEAQSGNNARREVAELIREAFLASLAPDVIHISSLFEGYHDNAVTSIGRFDRFTPVSVSLYDLIPLLNPDHYLTPDRYYAQYYKRKVGFLKKAAIYLAISEFSKQEMLAHLAAHDQNVVNVSTAIESCFQPLRIDEAVAARLLQKFGITSPFVFYTGGADKRKNLPRLIQAFAALPAALRDSHQLLLAGKMNDAPLTQHAKSVGLIADKLCFTGYVTDEELIQLYNLCQLFVFPSWHEGFGLPALEAMACGTPVIGTNTSSVPEVIGLEAALFDPSDVGAIANKMARALEDDAFRIKLREHGLAQAKKFSWDKSAKRAILALESLCRDRKVPKDYTDRQNDKLIRCLAEHFSAPDEAALSTLARCLAQNQFSGIERQLMIDISELVQRDAATGVQRVVRSYLKALLQSTPTGFRVEPVYATQDEGYRYARRFTQIFLGQHAEHLTDDPVQWQRGDIFLCLDMQHHVQLTHSAFYQQLRLDGVTVKFIVYDLLPIQLAEMFKDSNAQELHEKLLAMIAATDGAICISKATADAYEAWITKNAIQRTPNFQITWVHIGGDINGSKPSKGLPQDTPSRLNAIRSRPSFLCVGTLEPRKGQQQIVDAIQILWNDGLDVNLVLVGQQGWHVQSLVEILRNHPEKNQRLFWLQGISDEYLEQVYSASSCLIAASINEGFGLPIVEAARHKIPIVARDIPVFQEVAGDAAFYFSGDSPQDLAKALKAWLGLHQENRHPKSDQLHWITWQESTAKLKNALVQINYPHRQLLVDVSELVQCDAQTGIQRVVRSILKEWLMNPPKGYRVEPVHATIERGYRYARRFTKAFLGCPDQVPRDEPIEYAPADVFLALDMNHHVPRVHESYLESMKHAGVRIIFVVYDLLPIHFPHFWETEHSVHLVHQHWLHVITKFDGAMCISKAVADELSHWLTENGQQRHRPFTIDWFHLGADVNNSVPTKGFPDDADTIIGSLCKGPSFLMVGTLEPRKGHGQVLGAFEQLWQSGQNVNLVIVGKKGWLVENLVSRLRTHSELNKRLFWLEGISDEYLDKVYAVSTCLIAASYGEGFGLPLIEAAQHKLPIIARDIPVFKEVAGEHAYYFESSAPDALAQAIKEWLTLYDAQQHPKSKKMPWLTWRQSARQLRDAILPKNSCRQSQSHN